MKASLKPGYLKLNIAATAVGKEERKMLLITTCWMKASNALDDGHLMPSNPLFKRHWRFVLNLNLKFQKGGPHGIPREPLHQALQKKVSLVKYQVWWVRVTKHQR